MLRSACHHMDASVQWQTQRNKKFGVLSDAVAFRSANQEVVSVVNGTAVVRNVESQVSVATGLGRKRSAAKRIACRNQGMDALRKQKNDWGKADKEWYERRIAHNGCARRG